MIKNLCLMLAPSETPFIAGASSNPLPSALGVLAGYLRPQGYRVDLYDLNHSLEQKEKKPAYKERFQVFYDGAAILAYLSGVANKAIDDTVADLLADIALDSYDLFGISCGADYSFMEIHFALAAGRYIMDKLKKPVVLGSNNISYLYIFADTFRELWDAILTHFDFVVKGAGETALAEIIQALDAGQQPEDIKRSVKGLIRRENGRVAANPEFDPKIVRPDWDGLPPDRYLRYVPAPQSANGDRDNREALIQLFKWPDSWLGSPGQMANIYHQIVAGEKKIVEKLVIPYVFNYNCPYRCAYCTQSASERGALVVGDPAAVVEDMTFLMEHYGTPYFNFLNNAFNVSAPFVDRFCSLVLEKGLRFYWSDCARFNSNLTWKRLSLMRQAGCQNLTFGFDTASVKLLRMINKDTNLDRIRQILRWCHDLGIWVNFEIIVGLPNETDDDFMETYGFVSENRAFINCLFVNEYFIVPNSLIGCYPERYGIEIIESVTYAQILKKNLKLFVEGAPSLTRNAKIFKFDEIGGRKYRDIRADNKKRIALTNSIQNPEFAEVQRLYRMLIDNHRNLC